MILNSYKIIKNKKDGVYNEKVISCIVSFISIIFMWKGER